MTTPHRDLALAVHWERSLERARHRRAILPAARRAQTRRRRASVALSTLMVAGPTGSLFAVAGFGVGPRAEVAQASPANRAIDAPAPGAMAFELGDRGAEVAEIQRALGIDDDGIFGPVTDAAVRAFQQRGGLAVDGIVGPVTWTSLFGLENAAAAAGARDGAVAVIVRETAGGGGGAGGLGDGDDPGGGVPGGGPIPAVGGGGPGAGGPGESERRAVGDGAPPASRGGDSPTATIPDPVSVKRAPAPAPTAGACGSLRLASPVKGLVTSNYGPRWGRMHEGIDIAAPTGTPIRAAECGVVSFAGAQGGYGNMVCVKHSSRFETCYAHMTRSAVSSGQRVQRGQVIGYVGCTGSCTGPHLHFETRVDGAARDPRPYLAGGAVPGTPTVRAASVRTPATAARFAKASKSAPKAQTAWSKLGADVGATATTGAATAAPQGATGSPPAALQTDAGTPQTTPDPAPEPEYSTPEPAYTAPDPEPTYTAPSPDPADTTPNPAPAPAPEPTHTAPDPEPAYTAADPAPATATPEPTHTETPPSTPAAEPTRPTEPGAASPAP